MKRTTLLYPFVLALVIAGTVYADQDPTIVFYDKFIEVSSNAKSLDDIKPYLSSSNLSQMNDISKEDEQMFLEIIKEMRASMKRKSITSKVEGDKAILTIEAIGTEDISDIEVTVTLVKESGDWKVESEDFTSSVVVE